MPLLAGIEEAAANAAGTAIVVAGRLRVSVDPWYARTTLAPRIGSFLDRYPMLSVDLLTSNRREDMLAGVDLAMRFGPSPDSALIGQRVLDSPVVTCASPAYLETYGIPSHRTI